MYTELDELIEAIIQDDLFQDYLEKEKSLYQKDVMALMSRYQTLQTDYLRMKQYEKYRPNDDMKKQLQSIHQQMLENPMILQYYQSYHQLNDMLEEVSHIVFEGISEELDINMVSLRSKL